MLSIRVNDLDTQMLRWLPRFAVAAFVCPATATYDLRDPREESGDGAECRVPSAELVQDPSHDARKVNGVMVRKLHAKYQ